MCDKQYNRNEYTIWPKLEDYLRTDVADISFLITEMMVSKQAMLLKDTIVVAL